WANAEEVKHEYGINLLTAYPNQNSYGAIILAVAHNEFQKIDITAHKEAGTIIYDVKGILPKEMVNARL
ncbi:MAG TPA: nucleotide sugar dehydrogenase, partial [Bacteroidales bacterium]|nr:nucleotide sugar dehydrogenase [Bacteroidales bacterium]